MDGHTKNDHFLLSFHSFCFNFKIQNFRKYPWKQSKDGKILNPWMRRIYSIFCISSGSGFSFYTHKYVRSNVLHFNWCKLQNTQFITSAPATSGGLPNFNSISCDSKICKHYTPTLDLSSTPLLQDDSNKTILSEKKFSKECIRCCVKETRNIASLEELLGKTKENTLLNNIIYIHLFIQC